MIEGLKTFATNTPTKDSERVSDLHSKELGVERTFTFTFQFVDLSKRARQQVYILMKLLEMTRLGIHRQCVGSYRGEGLTSRLREYMGLAYHI